MLFSASRTHIRARVLRRAVPLIARFLRSPVELILRQWRERPVVYGSRERLFIHPTARVNDAILNTRSGTITIEENAFFGHQVMVLTGRHDITKFGMDRREATPTSGHDVVIGRGAWVASRAMVVGPCVIGEHAVVAAGSVVTSTVPPYAVVAGVPARVVSTIEERPPDARE